MSDIGTASAATAPLSIEQAVADLTAPEEKNNAAPETVEAAPNTEADPAAEDATEPETVAEGENAETEDTGEEAEEAELPAIEPPRFWDAEAKKRFGELPRDLQELVLSKETERDKATSKVIEEAALKRKAADGEASRLTQVTGALDKLLPQAIDTFKSRWEGVDWNQVIDEHGAERALKLKNQMESEQAIIQQLTAAKDEAAAIAHSRFVEAEAAKLSELCPDLVDTKEGPKRREALGQFLVKTGVPQHVIPNMSALEASLAYDAMQWRNAQAEAKAKSSAPKTPAKPAAPPKPTVRPTAAPARPGSPQLAKLKSAEARFRANPSRENLIALEELQGN